MFQGSQIDVRYSLGKKNIGTDETLRFNPFSAELTSPQQNKYVFACGEALENAAARLLEMLSKFFVASIVGDHGTGKTTLIYSLIPQLNSLGVTTSFLRLGKQSWRNSVASAYEQFSSVPQDLYGNSTRSRHCLIIDGFEQLPGFGKLALITAIHSHNRFPLRGYRGSTSPNLFMLVSAHKKQLMIPIFEKTAWKAELAMSLTIEKIKPLPKWLQEKIIQKVSERFEEPDSLRSPNCLRNHWFWLYDEYEQQSGQ